MRSRVVRVLLLTVAFSLVVISPAAAYIDAGSTTVMFQAIVAAIAAAGVSISMFWSRIRSFFKRGDRDPEVAAAEGSPGDASVPQ